MKRYHFLDGMRGLAALFVALHHFALTWGEHRTAFGTAPLAVDFFFCLSGFVLAHAYQERLRSGMSFAHFMLRRVVRLYPMYLIGAALGLAGLVGLFIRELTDFSAGSIVRATVLHVLYVPYLNQYTEWLFDAAVADTLFPLNNPAWSLFFELTVASTLYSWAGKHPHAPAFIVAISAVALVMAAFLYGPAPGWGWWNILGGLPRVTYAFFMGVLLFQHRHRLARLGIAHPALLIVALAILCGLPRLPGFREFWLIGALAGVPVLVAASAGVSLADDGARRLAEYAGRVSYPLYCVHYPILMLLAAAQWRPGSFAAGLPLFAATSLSAAHLLMVGIDEPTRRRLGAMLWGSKK